MALLSGSWDLSCPKVLPVVLIGLYPSLVNPHLLPQLCANLDTWRIMSPQNYRPQLQEHSPQPCKQYNLCHRRSQVSGRRDTGSGGRGGGCWHEVRAPGVEP